MNKTKQGYVAPLSELLVVRFEENLLTVSDQTQVNAARGGYDYYDLGED